MSRPAKGGWVERCRDHHRQSLDPLVLPATVEVRYQGGRLARYELPVETWLRKTTTTMTLDSHGPVTSVLIDPGSRASGQNRANNAWLPK